MAQTPQDPHTDMTEVEQTLAKAIQKMEKFWAEADRVVLAQRAESRRQAELNPHHNIDPDVHAIMSLATNPDFKRAAASYNAQRERVSVLASVAQLATLKRLLQNQRMLVQQSDVMNQALATIVVLLTEVAQSTHPDQRPE